MNLGDRTIGKGRTLWMIDSLPCHVIYKALIIQGLQRCRNMPPPPGPPFHAESSFYGIIDTQSVLRCSKFISSLVALSANIRIRTTLYCTELRVRIFLPSNVSPSGCQHCHATRASASQRAWCSLHWSHRNHIIDWHRILTNVHLPHEVCTKRPCSDSSIGYVVVVHILDILQTVFGVMSVYYYDIATYGNPIALLSMIWTIYAYLIMTVAIDVYIFIYRIWMSETNGLIVSSVRLIQICLIILNGTNLGIGLLWTTKFTQLGSFLDVIKIKRELIVQIVLITTTDTSIAVVLSFLLWRMKTRVMSGRLVSQMNTLMVYTIHTGALTSLLSLVTMVLYLSSPANNYFIYVVLYFILPKVYHNALLGALNGRGWMRANPDETKGYNSIHLSSITPNSTSAKSGSGTSTHQPKDFIHIASPQKFVHESKASEQTTCETLSETWRRAVFPKSLYHIGPFFKLDMLGSAFGQHVLRY
ncbi:hypothetical protein ABKN59_002333 [Abortiporus biennis]